MLSDLDLFFILKGNHYALSKAEIKAILESECYLHISKPSPPMVYRCKAPKQAVEKVADRGYYTRYCLEELYISRGEEIIFQELADIDFQNIIKEKSYRVSIRSLKGSK